MLQAISTETFIESIILFAAVYYITIAVIYYPKGIMAWWRRRMRDKSDNSNKDQVLHLKDKV